MTRRPTSLLGSLLATVSLLALGCYDSSVLVGEGGEGPGWGDGAGGPGGNGSGNGNGDGNGDDPNGSGHSENELPVQDGTGTPDDPANDDAWTDIEEPTVQENVFVLEDTACYESVDTEDDDRVLTFHFSCDPSSLGLNVGSIVVGTAHGGYLREVTDLDVDASTVTMETTRARLDQVFENGGFDAHLDLPNLARYQMDHSGTSLYSGTVGGANLDLELSQAVLNFDPDLRISTDFEWLRLQRARAVLDAEVDLDLELLARLSDSLSYSNELPLGTYTYPFAFAAGPVPVTGTLEVTLKAGFSTSASGSITATAGMEADADVTVGATYRRGRSWTFTQRKTFNANRTGPDIEAQGDWDGRVYVDVEATVMLYKVAGPSFGAQPWISGEAEAECYDLDWAFDAGVDLRAGLDLDVWVFELEKNFGPWTFDTRIGEGTITLPFPLGTNCGPEPALCNPSGTISCGQTVSGDTSGDEASASMGAYPINVGNYDAPEIVYTWTASGGNPVEFKFVDPTPTELNHDIIILDGTAGQCMNTSAVAWGFNTLEFTPTGGNTYYVVVDGYDGDAGAFQLELDCSP